MPNTHYGKIELEIEFDGSATTWKAIVDMLKNINIQDAEIVDATWLRHPRPIQNEPPDDTHNDF